MELYYSTGQVAEELETTQENIRRLCQAGAIRAELTPGGQHRVPQEEHERLMRDGLPPMPRPLPGDRGRPSISRSGTPPPGLLAEPSESLVESAEEVAKLAYQAKSLRLQRRIDTEHDYSRKREARIEQERREQAEALQARQAALDAERQRATWLRGWEEYAISRLCWSESELKLDVHAEVRDALSRLDPLPSNATCRRLVEAIIEQARHKAKCKKQSKEVVERAVRSLPYDIQYQAAYTAQKAEALSLMAEAVGLLPVDADEKLKEAVAQKAAAPVLQRYEHGRACTQMLNGLHQHLPQANRDEQELARRTLAISLEQLPVGASQATLEVARDGILAAVLERVEQRLGDERRKAEAERKQREEAQKRSSAEVRVTFALSEVDDVLRQLEREGEIVFDGFNDRWDTRKRMEETVAPLLVEAVLRQPEMTREAVRKQIWKLVRQNLAAVVPD